MDSNLEAPTSINGGDFLSPPSLPPLQKEDDNNDDNDDEDDGDDFYIDDSNCSTPFVSAPSSPGRSYYPSGFFYSAPASPMHFVLATAQARSSADGDLIPASSDASSTGSFEFEFSSRFDSPAPEIGPSMSSADELFLNGQIRPMRLCAHLQRPQKLPSLTLLESEREDEEDDDYCDDDEKSNVFQRSRLRNRSQRRRTRSLSPLRSTAPYEWYCSDDAVSTPTKKAEEEGESEGGGEKEKDGGETTPSGSSSRCSSAGRSSKRWVFLKDFLRSKSEGRSNNKFWHNINISFSPAKEKRDKGSNNNSNVSENTNVNASAKKKEVMSSKGKGMPGGKSRSAHEMHYAANRAQAEEMRKKTFLPYRQGLLGCLGFNSKSYGALNGFARALNPVSSR